MAATARFYAAYDTSTTTLHQPQQQLLLHMSLQSPPRENLSPP